MAKLYQISVRLSDEDLERLNDLKESTGDKISDIVRSALFDLWDAKLNNEF